MNRPPHRSLNGSTNCVHFAHMANYVKMPMARIARVVQSEV